MLVNNGLFNVIVPNEIIFLHLRLMMRGHIPMLFPTFHVT